MKSRKSLGELKPGPRGGMLRQGNTEGVGRPPNEYRAHLRVILDDPAVDKAVKAILKNPKSPQFAGLYKAVVNQAHGAPKQEIEVPANLPPLEVVFTTG